MAPPIQFGLGLSLARAGGAALDADAKAYIAAVETAGATVSGGQKKAIDTFYKTGKSDGWYSSIKRMYLPIWASAAPNAIDMMEHGSGTFNGTVTHAAGYAKGDGTTGYFDFGVSPSTLGLTVSSESVFALVKTLSAAAASTNYLLGSFNNASQTLFLSSQWRGTMNTTTGVGNISTTAANPTGIVMLDRAGGNRGIYIRRTAGLATVVETTSADAGTIPTADMHAWSMSNSGVPTISRDDELGSYGIAMGLGSTHRAAFSLALKNLWEGTTGLTLP
jgi:hypothetical protein